MLFAEVRGKLGRDGSRAHDRAEDLMTSTAFQLLRYLSFADGLGAVLAKVRGVGADEVGGDPPARLKVGSAGITAAHYDPWPHWREFGIPDMVVTLFAGSAAVGRLVVEVKLDAGKSGAADDESEPGEEEPEVPDPDQLVKYWRGLKRRTDIPALGVVYLTAGVIPPAEELRESVRREPGDLLGWLSWRDVWSAVRACGELPARDLAAILAAKGLKGFDGFHAKPVTLPASGRFWTTASRKWFAAAVPSLPTNCHFWATHEGDE